MLIPTLPTRSKSLLFSSLPAWLDNCLYPAVVVEMLEENSRAHVAYMDGDQATVSTSVLLQETIGEGSRVSVNWKGLGEYHMGTVEERTGFALRLSYDDGGSGWATLAQCRVIPESAGEVSGALAASFQQVMHLSDNPHEPEPEDEPEAEANNQRPPAAE